MLGGSRADGTHRPGSDWDLGVYHRGSDRPLDPADVRALGHSGRVSELGEWGPIMEGGAWLTVAGTPVDVLFRDLDVVERRLADAEDGRFEVLAQNGHLAGAPTYLPVGELATCVQLSGAPLPRPAFPERLAELAPPRWEGRAAVALMFAATHAEAADAVACVGMLAAAALDAAHARVTARREWVRNEKRLIERARLDAVQPLLARPGGSAAELAETVASVAAGLRIAPLRVR